MSNCDIYPLYKELTCSKYKCRPDGVIVTETLAKVPLEMLLKHTSERIIKVQEEVISTLMETKKPTFYTANSLSVMDLTAVLAIQTISNSLKRRVRLKILTPLFWPQQLYLCV